MTDAPKHVVRVESPAWRRAIVIAAIIAVGSSVVGTMFSPYLLDQYPTLLLMLSPEPRHVVLTANLIPVWLLIPLVVVRRVLGLAAIFAFGWTYGQRAVELVEVRFGAAGIMLRWAERNLHRFGAVVVFTAPTPAVCLMAGVAGTRLIPTVLAMFAGQLFWVTITWFFGDRIATYTAPILGFLSRHVIEATLICVFVVAAWQIRSYVRGRAAARRSGKGDLTGSSDSAPPGAPTE